MKDFIAPPQAPLRPPSEVMRLSRMGSMFATRLSFLRVLTRRLAENGTPPERTHWEMNEDGYGRAVYALKFYDHTYSLVALSQPLAPENRSDRVIATAWDAAFVLYDGIPDADELDRIAAAAPHQEAGRFTERDLVLSRANKSVRLWAHVVEALQAGTQPDGAFIDKIGYLMRTTAVYGNGKFGIADRTRLQDRPGLELSFMVEMLTVWLIRHFTHDLVEHVGGAKLDARLKRHLGIGNATGLGMAPFLVTHPILLNNWMMVRETALARVRAIDRIEPDQAQRIEDLAARGAAHLASWTVPDPEHQARIAALRLAFDALRPFLKAEALTGSQPMEQLWARAQDLSPDCQEFLVSVMLEPFGTLIDGLAECLTDPHGGTGRPFADTSELRAFLGSELAWAQVPDYADPKACAKFWYISQEKLEPRIGARHEEPGAELETPLDIGRRLDALARDLPEAACSMGAFLTQHPQHLMAVERAQIARDHPYSEIRDNLIDQSCLPIDMLRAKLSCFGATKFDPKSDLWTRITMAQGAPLAEDLKDPSAQDWWCPVLS